MTRQDRVTVKHVYVDPSGLIKACVLSVEFEDQDKIYDKIDPILPRDIALKRDTFYKVDCEVEIIEVPEYPINHTSYPPMKQVARLFHSQKQICN